MKYVELGKTGLKCAVIFFGGGGRHGGPAEEERRQRQTIREALKDVAGEFGA